MKQGSYTLKCKSICPTATYSAHCSIVTGTYPNVHGIVGNSFYDKGSRTIIDFDFDDVNKYVLSETLLERIQGTKITIGEPVTRGAEIVITKAKVQSKKLSRQDAYVINEAVKLIEQYKPLLMIMNLPGVDSIGELYGPLSKEMLNHLEMLDKLISNLKESLERIYDDFLFIILADHGMTSVKENVNLSEVLDGLNVVTCISHRAAHIYAINEDVRKILRRLEADDRFEAIIFNKKLVNYQLKSPRSGDLVVIAKDGYELGLKPLKGSHGGISPNEIFVPLVVNKPEYVDLLKYADITIVPKLVLRYLREINAINIVKKRLKNGDSAHDWEHTSRVLKLATQVAAKHKGNIEVIRIGCLFHDAERGLKPKGHEKRAALLAEEYLRKSKCSDELIDKVKTIILNHHADPNKLKTIEEKILWDADKLDALGLIGLARCFMEAGFYKHDISHAVKHLLKDLKEFKDKMHFHETKRLAKIRVSNALEFVNKLKEEQIND
jgi:uncharacterized protein